MTSTLLTGGMVLCLGPADRIYDRGDVLIEDERIAAVGPVGTLGTADSVIDATGRLIMPGLVNAHTHTPMTLFRGLAEGVSLLTMEGWYNTIRLLELKMTADMVPASVEVACAEMIRTGTTTFADQYFFMDEIIPVAQRSGLRAALAYGIVELNDAAARERELAALDGFLESINSVQSTRVRGWVGPHAFFVDNSVETMLRERALAHKYATGLHIHISTTGEEDAFCADAGAGHARQPHDRCARADHTAAGLAAAGRAAVQRGGLPQRVHARGRGRCPGGGDARRRHQHRAGHGQRVQ
jgi:5-methylthioadenosine/S-adenosylhomocysteine deaminase